MKLKDAYKDFELARICIDIMRNGKYVKECNSDCNRNCSPCVKEEYGQNLVKQFPEAEGKLSVHLDRYGDATWQFEFNGTVEESEITELTDALDGRR